MSPITPSNFSISKRNISKDETTKTYFSYPIQLTEMETLAVNSKVANDKMFSSHSNASQHSSPAHQTSALPLFTSKHTHMLALATIQNSVTGIY